MIGPKHVLSAGHCACGQDGSYRATAANSVTGAGTKWFGIVSRSTYPGYRCGDAFPAGSDLSMFTLAVTPRRSVHRLRHLIALPAKATDPAFRVFGYGFTERRTIGVRMTSRVPVATATCDKAKWGRLGCEPFVEFILAAGPGTRFPSDTCGGDSADRYLRVCP